MVRSDRFTSLLGNKAMKTVTRLDAVERGNPVIATIGAFDGVHRGHQFLIRQVVERARCLDFDSLVLTFDPSPAVVLRPGSLQLTGAREKARIIGAVGPDVLAILPFSPQLAEGPAGQFLASIIDRVNLSEIWVGSDFAFGHKREGNVDFLIRAAERLCFAVHIVPRQRLQETPISSTLVREMVVAGDMEGAARFLGHYVSLKGTVVAGFGRGTQMGVPTANVRPPSSQLLPAIGVYAAYLRVDSQQLPAAVSVGYNVVFAGTEVSVEAHVLDFDGDLRDREVAIDFVARILDEEKFESVEALVAQMHRDIETVRRVLAVAEEPGELLLAP